MNKTRPVLLGNAIFASLQVLTGAAVLTDVVGDTTFGVFVILVAAAQVGFNTYVQGSIVPVGDVGAYTNSDGVMVAGPASGTTNGKEVDVVKTDLPSEEPI